MNTQFSFTHMGVEDKLIHYRAILDFEPDDYDTDGFAEVLDWLVENTDGRFAWSMNHALTTSYEDVNNRDQPFKLEANDWKRQDIAVYSVWIRPEVEAAFKLRWM